METISYCAIRNFAIGIKAIRSEMTYSGKIQAFYFPSISFQYTLCVCVAGGN